MVPPQDLASRPRRNRRSATVREAFRETILTPSNFIYPIFVHDGEEDIPIDSMPGQSRLGWKTGMIDKVREARAAGVNQVVVFPKTPDNLKTATAEECFNPNGLAQRSISLLKDTFPDLEVYTDVALDPYNTMGHDGMVRSDGVVMNDETVYYLCKQAVSQARAGADVISPSDMMDGRVGAIREALDAEGFTNVAIMSYTAKYVCLSVTSLSSHLVPRTRQFVDARARASSPVQHALVPPTDTDRLFVSFDRARALCWSNKTGTTRRTTALSATRSLRRRAPAAKTGRSPRTRLSTRWTPRTTASACARLRWTRRRARTS